MAIGMNSNFGHHSCRSKIFGYGCRLCLWCLPVWLRYNNFAKNCSPTLASESNKIPDPAGFSLVLSVHPQLKKSFFFENLFSIATKLFSDSICTVKKLKFWIDFFHFGSLCLDKVRQYINRWKDSWYRNCCFWQIFQVRFYFSQVFLWHFLKLKKRKI